MLLNFYVQANSHSADQDASYFESASSWLNNAVTNFSEFSWQESMGWITLHTRETIDSAKGLFRYLSGDPVPSNSAAAQVSLPAPRKQESPLGDGKGFWSSFAGLFGSLKGGTGKGPYEGALDTGHGSVWQEGEVHADLVRVGPEDLLMDHILTFFRTPPDISSFGISSLTFQVGSVIER